MGEPLAGTTPVNRRWLCVEHPGPWAPDITGADPVLVGLHKLARRAGARLELIRRPGQPNVGQRRRSFLADTTPGASQLSILEFTRPAELLDLDLDAELPGHRVGEPVLLACTHGRRDQCCAIDGRILAAAVPGAWECTHLGGHRFAPTAVVLPTGYAYGRLDAETAVAAHAAAAAGQVLVSRCRGRSTWRPSGQVAELAVRELAGERDADALAVSSDDDAAVRVEHTDGRSWRVTVERAAAADPRPSSCGAEPTPMTALAVTGVQALATAAPAPR